MPKCDRITVGPTLWLDGDENRAALSLMVRLGMAITPYAYNDAYHDNRSCYVVQRRVHTKHGWRLQPRRVQLMEVDHLPTSVFPRAEVKRDFC
jgi:hypothetical protein